jgi:hypothetical protein
MSLRWASLALAIVFGCGCGRKSQSPTETVEHIAEATRRGDQAEAARALAVLASQGPAAVAEIGLLLREKDQSLRQLARSVLGDPANTAALDIFVRRCLTRLEPEDTRQKRLGPGWHALIALGPVAFPSLARVYGPEFSEEQRERMMRIASVNDPAALLVLEKGLTDPSPRVVGQAASALHTSNTPDARARLLVLLSRPEVEVRAGAIDGLKRLGDPSIIPVLLPILEEPDVAVPTYGTSSLPMGPDTSTLHGCVAEAINQLTGEPLDGDVTKIRQWLAVHPDLATPR